MPEKSLTPTPIVNEQRTATQREVDSKERHMRFATTGMVLLLVTFTFLFLPWPRDETPAVEPHRTDTPMADTRGGNSFNSSRGQPTSIVATTSQDLRIPRWARMPLLEVAIVACVVLIFLRAKLRFEIQERLIRQAADLLPDMPRVLASRRDLKLLPARVLSNVARTLNTWAEIPSCQLDVGATVSRTVAHAERLSPSLGTQCDRPQYLFLVERASGGDQAARFFGLLIEHLIEQDVLAHRFYYSGSPRVCFPDTPDGTPLTLEQLAAEFPDSRLVLFGELQCFFDAWTGQLEPWAEQLHNWKHCILLTPEPVEHWTHTYEQLHKRQFTVLPASIEGLAALTETLENGKPFAVSRCDGRWPLPDEVNTRQSRWVERAPPEPAFVERTLHGLRMFLGDAGYYWLSACAVFPSLHLQLTLHLGEKLQIDGQRQLGDLDTFLRLSRLPWFRYGYMPEWLRRRLVSDLPRPRKRQVRAVLKELLTVAEQARALPETNGESNGVEREVSKKPPADDEVPDLELGRKQIQTTHDYLVPLLREWMPRKQPETQSEQTGLKLADRSTNATPASRHLPKARRFYGACAAIGLASVGIVVVIAVPGIREGIQGKLGGKTVVEGEDNSRTGDSIADSPIVTTIGYEPAPEAELTPQTRELRSGEKPFDYTLLAKAEQKLQAGDPVEAAHLFGQLEQSLSHSRAAESASLLDYARLGLLRAKARQSDVDWSTTLTALQQLRQSGSLGEQASARVDALELLGKTTLSQLRLEERIKELVRLRPLKKRLDSWENTEIARIQADTLGELAEAQQEVSLAPALLDDVERLGGDKVSLLLARAERQYNQHAFADSRITLAKVGDDARDEDRIRRDKILLMNDLADDACNPQETASRFASATGKLQDPTELVELLLQRARNTPEIIDTAVEQLAQVGKAAVGESRSKLERAHASLLALRIRSRLASSDVSVADLLRDCENVRTIDETDPLVNACWVECRILSSANELYLTTWTQLGKVVQQAIGSSDVESSHVAYFHYVAGLLRHNDPTPRSRDGADEILKTRDMDYALLETPRRRQQIGEILVAAAAEVGLPTDADLPHEFIANEDTHTAYNYLEFASRWETPPTDAWKANYIIAGALVDDAQAADKWLQLSDEMLASPDSTAFLESKQLIGQVLFLSADGFTKRFNELQQPADRDKAIQRYAALIARLHDARRVDPGFADLALYTKVVRPAYELARRSFPDLDQVPAELKPSLARIYGTCGRLIERDAAVSQLVLSDSATPASAEQAFVTAAKLDARAEYFVGVGRAIINSPDYFERLPELKSLADRVQLMDDQRPEGHLLEGSALVIESRLKTKCSESRELLQYATKACEWAVTLSKPGDDDYASNYEVLSTACLKAAYYADTLEERKEYLVAAEVAAVRATQVANRPRPENAYNCLGNALEDQAYYLGEVAKYEPALDAFIDGAGAATEAGRDASNSLYAAGRCRLRLAHSLSKSERGKALDQAEYELDQAIKTWRLLSQKKKAIQRRLGEAEFWRSEVIRTRAMGLPTIAEALPVLGEAELARAESVKLAKSAQSIYWDEFQVEWSKLALDQAKSSDSIDEAKKFLLTSVDRAQAVLTEHELKTSSLQVSPRAVQDALVQLIQVDQIRYGYLLNVPDSQWTLAHEEEAEGYVLTALENAKRIQDEAISRSARIALQTNLGTVKLKSAINFNLRQKAAVAWASAEKSFGEAVALSGDNIGLSAPARLGLAKSLMHRISESNVALESTKLRDEGLQLLGPINLKAVDPNFAFEISRLISRLEAVK